MRLIKIIVLFLLAHALETSAFQVMTFNMKNDSVETLKTMQEFFTSNPATKPQLVLLQEMHIRYDDQNLTDTVKDFSSILDYPYYAGISRPKDYEAVGIASTFPFMLNPLNGKDSVWALHFKITGKHKRAAIFADFNVPKIGRLRVINTHLEHIKTNGEIRKSQMTELLDFMEHLQKIVPADAIIFGGDLNSNKTESFYVGELDAITTGTATINFLDFNGTDVTSHDARRIDYIFHTPLKSPLTFERETILFSSPILGHNSKGKTDIGALIKISDHNAVMHTFKLGK